MAALDAALTLPIALGGALTTEATLSAALAVSVSGSASLNATSHLAAALSLVTAIDDGTNTATGAVQPQAHLSAALTITISITGRIPLKIERQNVTTVSGLATPFAWTHTCANATLLIVFVNDDSGGTNPGIGIGVTYNDIPLTRLGVIITSGYYYVYALASPPTGNHQLKITGARSTDLIYGSAVSYRGARPLLPYHTLAAPTGAALVNVTAPVTYEGSWVLIAAFDRSGVSPTGPVDLTRIDGLAPPVSLALFDTNGPLAVGPHTYGISYHNPNAGGIGMFVFAPHLEPAALSADLSLSISARVWGEDTTVYVEIAGIPRIAGAASGGVLVTSLSISDAIDGEPNTCSFTAIGLNNYRPLPGQRVLLAYEGPLNPSRLFNGQIVQTSQIALSGVAHVPTFACSCIDDTWRLRGRLVIERYQNQSVTFIAKDLMAKYAPGFTVNQVASSLPVLDEFTVTNGQLPDALTLLVRRFGGHWDLDYFGDLILGLDFVLVRPRALTATHPSMTGLDVLRDLTQEANRVFYEGGGVQAIETVMPGETSIPVQDAAWYRASGGLVASGPQRIAYGAAVSATGGTLVGPGAAPLSGPNVTIVADAASQLGIGRYGYAVVDVTPNGRSLAGPITFVTTGPIAPPPTAPETALAQGGGLDTGSHDYEMTFVFGSGETLPSPLSVARSAGSAVPPPASAPGLNYPPPYYSGNVVIGHHEWAITWCLAGTSFETTPGPRLSVDLPNVGLGGLAVMIVNLANPPYPGLSMRVYRTQLGSTQLRRVTSFDYTGDYGTMFSDNFTDLSLGGSPPSVNTLLFSRIQLSSIPVSALDTCTGKNIYRRFNGGTAKRVATIGNGVTAYLDQIPNASLGVTAPSVATAQFNGVSIVGVPLGTAPTSARDIYRTPLNGSTLQFLFRINDNVNIGAPAPIASPTTIGAVSASANTTPGVTSGPVGPHQWAFTFRRNSDGAETGPSPLSTVVNMSLGGLVSINLGGCSTPPSGWTRVWYRNQSGGSTYYRMPSAFNPLYWLENTASGQFIDVLLDENLLYQDGHTMPAAWTGGYLDEAPDAALGANAPGADTSGIPQPVGQVLAGSPTLVVAGAAGHFLSTGGWAIVGNGANPVRYSGISGNSLTGIPTSGPGSIVTTIPYDAQITAADMLTGIPPSGTGAIHWPILDGDSVNLVVQVDDTVAQTALSALLDPSNKLGGRAGIRESYQQDGRLSYTEALARARAMLALLSPQIVGATYACRDPLSVAGALIDIDIPAPTNASATLKILSVRISEFGKPGTFPTYQVTAGVRFSFEELLRFAEGG